MSVTDTDVTPDAPDIAAGIAQAKARIQAARFAEAEAVLTRLLERTLSRSHEIEARYNLAVARRYGRDLEGALGAVDALIAVKPDHARAYQERGHALEAGGRVEDAARAYGQAVELNPGLVASWKALSRLHERAGRGEDAAFARAQARHLESLPAELRGATDLIHEGRLYQAEQVCRHFLRRHPHHVEAMRLLADVGVQLRIYDDAEFLLESCIEFAPDHTRARMDYLALLNRKGKFRVAFEQARALVASQPGNPAFELALATATAGLGRLEEAIERYRACLDSSPNKPGVHVALGHAQKAAGAVDAAIASYREACRLRPDYGDAYWSLANTKTYRFSDDEIAAMRRHEADERTGFDDRVHLGFAIGKALEDRADYAASFEHYARGNAARRRRSGYDPDQTSTMMQAQIEHCTASLFERRGHCGSERTDPIFIVGLPRAGSTLLEQILASHSRIDGTMELHEILGLAQRLRGRSAERAARYPRNLWEIDDGYFRRFGEQFIESTRVYRGAAPLFVDKMPNNFMHVGLIRLILPNAKVIDARRGAMACCFSNYKQLFGEGHDFSYDLEWLGRYYRDYVGLMEHWDRALPGFVLRVRHEDVVADLETQVRRILEFCGLPFEQRCLEFHKTERSVRTPSSEQVRRPIYRSGLEQWRNYADWLGPLRTALGAEILESEAGDASPS